LNSALAILDVSLPLRLRSATADAHRRLETALDLLAPPLSRDRFTALLMRWRGFHAVWEPAIGRHGALSGLMAGRYRLDLIDRDLAALGLSRAEIEAAAPCEAAAGLAVSAETALGSLYVLEGSSLGGQFISRALKTAPWLPSGGLTYFDPYGPETGVMWRGFQAALTAKSSLLADPQVEKGAADTFALLQAWLAER
jgi:heme oxygenase